jgi:tetratricopeptide (TPR) repeat protein
MNLAIKTRDSLEFIDPGTHYIGHDGLAYPWPFDSLNHKNLSIYGQNNFGDSKSYHIMGTYSKYFGAYWQHENFGMIHYANREDKPGRKVFMWALSNHGKIWEKLLTDNSGQYCEIQSGRLFNQNVIESSHTPFKQVGFAPYHTDAWTEYWYPYKNTDGVANADLNGVINIQQGTDSLTVFISPVSEIDDTLKLIDKTGNVIYLQKINLQPLQSYQKSFLFTGGKSIIRLELAGSVIDWNGDTAEQLSRPLDAFPGFDWNTAYGLYLMGRDLARYKDYIGSEIKIRASLEKETGFIPSLTEMAFLQYRKMQYDSAFYYARKALSIETYNPAANYYYGLSAEKLGKWYDAADGFELAALTADYRSAAYIALSRMYLHKGNYQEAYEYANRSLDNDGKNMSALKLRYLVDRLAGNDDDKEAIKQKILELDPLNHFIRFEEYWEHKGKATQEAFTRLIRNELPQETYLELAIWYYELNRLEESKVILSMSPTSNVISYWQAFLHKEDPDTNKWLDAANNGNPRMAFPFREETATVMKWAIQNTSDWKPRYYLALIQSFRNNKTAALSLLNSVQGIVDFPPFYITKASLYDSTETVNKLQDLSMAISLNKQEWRYGKYLTEFLLGQKQYAQALKTIEPYYKKDVGNYITGMLYTHCLMQNNKYDAAEKLLDNIHILPFEGATDGHQLYEQIKLMLALQLLQNHCYKAALQKVREAREWPEKLGVGKPYPDMINVSLENGIEKLIQQTMRGYKLSNSDMDTFRVKVKSISMHSDI